MPNSYIQGVDDTFDKAQDEIEGAGSALKSKLSESAASARDKVQNAGRNVQAKIDETRAPAAEKLQNVASALHEKADQLPGGETVAGIAHKTADTMQATAEYVRRNDLQNMMGDVRTFVRKRPGQSLIAAAALGFLLGRTLRSDD